MADPIAALTEREKQTLRLLLDGHDAKSIARECGLSVHTINERLRDARRKLSVSSSREAARLLRAHDLATPQLSGDEGIGAASPTASPDIRPRPGVPRPTRRWAAWAIGAAMIALTLILALSLPLSSPPSSLQADALPPAAASHRTDASDAALRFLVLIDAARWDESWAATGPAFQSLNDRAAWRAASIKARVPPGAVLSRQWLGEIDTPTPPAPPFASPPILRTARLRSRRYHSPGRRARGRWWGSISSEARPAERWCRDSRFLSMRPAPAALAAALLLAACGQPSARAPTAPATPDPNGYAAKVAALAEPLRAGVMLRAIRDAGQQCQQVVSAKAAPGASPPAWIATCADHRQWVVGIGDDGTASVTAGADIARRGGS